MRKIIVALLALLLFLYMVLLLHQSYGDAALVGIFGFLVLSYVEPAITP